MAATGKGSYPHLDRRFRISAPIRRLTLTRAAGNTEKVAADYFWKVVAGTQGQIKYWTGSAWSAKPVKYWTGTQWVTKPLKYWNGTQWITTPY